MKITQYARISHHTLSGFTNSVFTVAPSGDFTDGTWTIYDLAPSEFGVNETSKRAFLRCDNEIKELKLASFSTASTIGTASETIAQFSIGDIDVIKYKIQVKGQSVDSPYETIISDVSFGLKAYGSTSSIAFVGGTYSVSTTKDFSAVGIGPDVSISGLIATLSVNGAVGYTISWSANIESF